MTLLSDLVRFLKRGAAMERHSDIVPTTVIRTERNLPFLIVLRPVERLEFMASCQANRTPAIIDWYFSKSRKNSHLRFYRST